MIPLIFLFFVLYLALFHPSTALRLAPGPLALVLQDIASPLPLAMFVHLLDSQSTVWGGRDILSVSTAGWEAGDIFVQVHHFPLPSDVPMGEYQLEIGIHSRTDMQRFAIFEGGQPVADRLLLEPISITSR